MDFTKMTDDELKNLSSKISTELLNREETKRKNYLDKIRALIKEIQNDGFDVEFCDDIIDAYNIEII